LVHKASFCDVINYVNNVILTRSGYLSTKKKKTTVNLKVSLHFIPSNEIINVVQVSYN